MYFKFLPFLAKFLKKDDILYYYICKIKREIYIINFLSSVNESIYCEVH